MAEFPRHRLLSLVAAAGAGPAYLWLLAVANLGAHPTFLSPYFPPAFASPSSSHLSTPLSALLLALTYTCS